VGKGDDRSTTSGASPCRCRGDRELAHGHGRFQGRRIFATLGNPDADFGMVKLTPEQQEMLVAAEPAIFQPVKGGWGARAARPCCAWRPATRPRRPGALTSAWRNVASKTCWTPTRA
jgi:hypothetical protein